MKRSLSHEKVPICTVEIGKDETSLGHIDEVIEHLKRCVEAEPLARFIAIYDHYAHTRSLPGGTVCEGILAAKNLIFCFGITLPSAETMALRPRAIGVCELADRFVLSFTEPPMPVANLAIEKWTALGCDRRAAVANTKV